MPAPVEGGPPLDRGGAVAGVSEQTERKRPEVALGNTLTVCPFCACGCGLYLQLADGKLSGVMPSEHHPVSGGRLCARGWAAHEASLWGRRLLQPLVRRNGTQQPTSWSEALQLATQRLTDLIAGGEPIGVLGSARATNEENFMAVRLARAALRTDNVDTCLRAPYQALLSGISEFGPGHSLDSVLDTIERCEVILLVEGDVAVTHPRAALAIMMAVRRGARLITMGQVPTQMSRLAWLHLELAPGDDPVLAARLIAAAERVTGKESLWDGSSGGDSDAHAPNPADVRPAARLRQALEAYRIASRAAIILAPTGAEAPWLRAVASGFARLAAKTGHLKRPGSVILPLPLRANTRGALEMGAAPNCLPGLSALGDGFAARRLRRVWGGEPATQRGLDLVSMLGEVRGLVVLADNPHLSLPSGDAAKKALAGLDCLIVLDAFVTPTVEASHIALPIHSPAESDGTYTNMEGRVQWVRACARPPADARAGWRVLSELGAALGMSATHESIGDVQHDIAVAVPQYAEPLSQESGTGRAGDRVLPGILGDHATQPAGADYAYGSIREMLGEPVSGTENTSEFPFRLERVGLFEWGDDTLVECSPTLWRDHKALRKQYPDGFVEMNSQDADRLGVRRDWKVKVVSASGEVTVPVRFRDDLRPGIVLTPFAFRDHLERLLKRGAVAAVRVERI